MKSGGYQDREQQHDSARQIPGGITPVLLFLLFLNAAALAAGQLLFKSTAIRVKGLPFAAMVSKIAFVPSFYAACLLYAAATVIWVWLLTQLPLSTAYPFVGISFVMVALAGWFVLGETLSIRGCIGVLMVAAGVVLVASSAGVDFLKL